MTVAREPVTHAGVTAAVPEDGPDGSARCAYLTGRVGLAVGDRVKVVGTLRVRRHPAAVVGAVLVPAWVEGGRVVP